MNYDNILKFDGTWRNYQARVLESAKKYMEDGKIHIVAAPGSGKTTLGIELIARMGEVALVLAPSITIRQQWVARIKEAFLNKNLNIEDYVSQDLKNPRCITVATYQALHSAMNKYKGILDETDTTAGSLESDDKIAKSRANEEEVDYSSFDVITEMKNAHVGVLCLDECHHLRSEWWKALEEFKNAIGKPKMIALTATPPYDSTPAMWKRYMDMCGEIDEEISIPELVKEGSLCPHQDFVYFNYPTEEEMGEITKFANRSTAMQKRLYEDEDFKNALLTHRGLLGNMSEEELLNEGDYLSALLIFLNKKGISIPEKLLRMGNKGGLPDFTVSWFETLLQGFLYEDVDSYGCDEEYRAWLENEIKAEGLIEKKKVCLMTTEAMEKLLISSKGKCESIKKIVAGEYENLGQDLRMLILTDYIRKEYEKSLGVPENDVTSLGVLPFFEQIRREGMSLRLGVLCGTIVIIPAEAKEALLEAIGTAGKVSFGPAGNLPQEDYLKVTAVGDNHFLTQAVTDIFTNGQIQVLIGTKSLLGEGWDSPCINSLILASFVGAFMLSNQMRGRAIRVFRKNPDKTSNIWHLVCLRPRELMYLQPENDQSDISEDFSLLERRMEHFLGLHYTQDVIENGMERMSIICGPYEKEHVAQMNEQMLNLSKERKSLKERWNRALTKSVKFEVADATEVEEKAVSKQEQQEAKKKLILSGIGVAAGTAMAFSPLGMLGGAVALAFGAYGAVNLRRTSKLADPKERLLSAGEGIYLALSKQNMLEEKAAVAAGEGKNNRKELYLSGGSGRDKMLFAKCVREFYSAVNDQRYLLVKQGKRTGSDAFYCVPDCFARRKEDAELFYSYMKKQIGKYDVVYTRNEAGKKLLLEGRMKSLADAGKRTVTHKKVQSL